MSRIPLGKPSCIHSRLSLHGELLNSALEMLLLLYTILTLEHVSLCVKDGINHLECGTIL